MFRTYDDYLSRNIGFGKYQYQQFLIISMSELFRGITEILLPILTLQFKYQWTITSTQQSFMNFVYPLNTILGIFLSANYSDRIGRNRMITFCYGGFTVLFIFFVFVDNMVEVIFCIAALGILQGILIPIGLSLISEMIPTQIRGKALVTFYFMQLIGIIYVMIMCHVFLISYQQGNWRGLLISMIPLLAISTLISSLYGSNSARLLLYQGKYVQAFQLIEHMGYMNNVEYEPLSSLDKDILIKWKLNMAKQMHLKKIKFVDLFKKKKDNKQYTVYLIIIYVCFGLVSYGYLVIFPYLYLKAESTFSKQLISYTGDVLGFTVNLLTIDDLRFGRKKSAAYCLSFLIFIQMFNIFIQDYQLTLGLILIRFCLRIIQPTLGVLILESYSTPYRSLGVGTIQVFFRLFSAFSSILTILVYEYSRNLLYFIWILLSLISSYYAYNYPIDRTQIQLDEQVTTCRSLSLSETQEESEPLSK